MQIGIKEERPPFVTFAMHPVEDRDASVHQGYKVMKDIPVAYVTPSGSKDRIMRFVSDWFPALEQQVQEGRYPQAWLDQHRRSYEYWSKGQEAPPNGVALSSWPAIAPGQLQNCQAIGIRTVEDLAGCNEEAIRRIGIGAYQLRERAKTYLQTARGDSALAEEMSTLRDQNETVLEELNRTRLALDEAMALINSMKSNNSAETANPFARAAKTPAGQTADEQLEALGQEVSATLKQKA